MKKFKQGCDHKLVKSKCIRCGYKFSKRELEFMKGAEKYKRDTSIWS